MIVEVFIENNGPATDQTYEYIVPQKLEDVVCPAKRVIVPFGKGNRLIQALIVHVKEHPTYELSKLKPIRQVMDAEPVVPSYLIELVRIMREEYFCTYAEALKCILSHSDKVIKKERYVLSDTAGDINERVCNDLITLLQEKQALTFDQLKKKLAMDSLSLQKELSELIKQNVVQVQTDYAKGTHKIYVNQISLSKTLDYCLNNIFGNAAVQKKVLLYLAENGVAEERQLKEATGAGSSSIKALAEKGLIQIKKEYMDNLPVYQEEHTFKRPILTFQQQQLLDAFENDAEEGKQRFLIHGVTGSGKTEIYLNLFEKVLQAGKQCLMLVPEISLTPQMMQNIYRRFGKKAAIMHSKLTTTQRALQWEKIRTGEASIVLGARSALFMPFQNLGMIVIDEEHENSYKSGSSPRYDTVFLANRIADLTGCKLILGSATPSVESYEKALKKEYVLLSLPERANRKKPPQVHIIDMKKELYTGNRSPISHRLADELKSCLKRKEQSVLFINRRGFSTYVFCRSCGYIEKCPDCDVSLTYHKKNNELVCHYCGFRKPVPRICPECGSDKIKYMGTGTQKIEAYLQELLPEARILRMDSDTTQKRGAFEKIIRQFGEGDADILLGTQMVVKGLDFANVTLVGILLADASLNFPDLNAAQRTFQLATQAAGRAGRAEKEGLVIMQTYEPHNPTLIYASMHDYPGFFGYDIAHRQKMGYPPFTEIMGIFTAHEEEQLCNREINILYRSIQQLLKRTGHESDVKLYRPMPAFIHKLKGKYMMHILLRYSRNNAFKKEFRKEYNQLKSKMKSTVFVEINPITLL